MDVEDDKRQLIDPVCRMEVTQGSRVPTFTYQSKIYYFCAESCRRAFATEPEKYLQKKPARRKGWWGRYLDRLNKTTGGKSQCCH
jgi:YHS domain-containing protein